MPVHHLRNKGKYSGLLISLLYNTPKSSSIRASDVVNDRHSDSDMIAAVCFARNEELEMMAETFIPLNTFVSLITC